MSDDDRAAVRLATAEAEAEGERLKLEREEPQRQAPAAAAAPPAARPPAAAAAQNGTHAASPPAAPRPDPSAAPATWRAVRTDALSPSPAAAQVLGRWGLSTCGLLADWLADRGGALGGTGSSSAAEVLKSAGVRHRDAQQVVRELKAVRRQYEGKAKANTKQAPAPENQAAPQA
ncbi:MAG: hypothetical protein IT200_17035, partial [Thermoleophilia bacterium]|nr:hypothetical protein [Thermoleophilia bacterium]